MKNKKNRIRPLIDLAEITLENLSEYQDNYKNNKKLNKKEYQHKYYLEVTKPNRKLKNSIKYEVE